MNEYMESLMNWKVDFLLTTISGRDIAFIVIGFFVCLTLWAISDVIRETNNERNKRGR